MRELALCGGRLSCVDLGHVRGVRFDCVRFHLMGPQRDDAAAAYGELRPMPSSGPACGIGDGDVSLSAAAPASTSRTTALDRSTRVPPANTSNRQADRAKI